MLSFSLWDVGVWGMENGGEQRERGKAVGSLTRHILWLYLWKTFCLSFISFQPIPKVHAMCPPVILLFLGRMVTLNGCFNIAEYRYPWNSGSGSSYIIHRAKLNLILKIKKCEEWDRCINDWEFHDGDSRVVQQAHTPSLGCWASTPSSACEVALAGHSLSGFYALFLSEPWEISSMHFSSYSFFNPCILMNKLKHTFFSTPAWNDALIIRLK